VTLSELYKKTAESFAEAGIDSHDHEAELLICRVMRVDRTHLMIFGNREACAERIKKVRLLAEERISGRPLQYVLGVTDFMGFDIRTDERVLIPRPETELLVDAAAEEVKRRGNKASVLDLCTGSGVIAGCVAALCPEAEISASDISAPALELARINCGVLSPDGRVRLFEADLFEGNSESYDLILSNPPYIASAVLAGLQREVRDYEPRLALDGGEDGLDVIRRIIKEAPAHLKAGGMLMIEIGHDQGGLCVGLALAAGFSSAIILKDLEGHDRILRAVL